MARGHTQQEGTGYEQPFAYVAMLKNIRIFLSIVECLENEIQQMDVEIVSLTKC